MIRNFKALGLALVAVFAMASIAASSAFATDAHFTADSQNTNVIITAEEDTTEPNQEFTTDFGIVNCNIVHAEGTSHRTATTITAEEIEYNSNFFEESDACEAFGLEADISFNGCHYLFHAGTWNDTAQDATGSVDLECPEGQEVEIDVSGLCTVSVPAQENLQDITYTNDEGDVTIDAEVEEEIVYSGAGLLCAGENLEDGTYFGKATVTAFEDTLEEAPVEAEVGPAVG